jgi:hypothetical protein
MSDEPTPESLLERLKELRACVERHTFLLRARGLETNAFLTTCNCLEAALNGTASPDEIPRLLAEFSAFGQKLSSLPDWPPTDPERAAAEVLAGMLLTLDDTVAVFRRLGGESEIRAANELQHTLTRIHSRIRQGEMPTDEFQDFLLTVTAQNAEVKRRLLFRTAALAIYWENAPQEKWDALPDDALESIFRLVLQWQETERERILGNLPLADRRRLEEMETFNVEQWTTPGVFEP